jgi:hypothetical protein
MVRRFSRVAFVASPTPDAQEALGALTSLYPIRVWPTSSWRSAATG